MSDLDITSNIQTARMILWRKFQPAYGTMPEFAERITDAVYMGLCLAASNFKPGVAKFSTFAIRRCVGEFIDDVRRVHGRAGSSSIRSRIHLGDADCAVNDPEDVDARDYLETLGQRLTERQRYILSRRFIGATFSEIAQDLGITVGRVSQIFTEIKEAGMQMGSPFKRV